MGTWDWDLTTNVDIWSPTTLQIFGIESSSGEVSYKTFMQHVHADDRAMVNTAVQACLAGLSPYSIEHRIIRADGALRWIAEMGDVVRAADGTPARMLGVTIDITARKQAEDAIATEKERLAVTLRSIGDGVISTDMDGVITLMNRVAEELTGWSAEAACGRNVNEVFRTLDEETRAVCPSPVAEVVAQHAIVQPDEARVLVTRAGEERIVRSSAAPICDRASMVIGAVLVFRDVSAERRTEEELLKAQKIESISMLAGGIAHDFNNLLTVVLGNVSLARMHAETNTLVNERLNDAETAVAQAMQLTQQLLTFARGGAPVKKQVAVGQLVRDTVPLLLRGSAVRCDLAIPPDVWMTEIDPGQISQVVNNLVINAVQAMPQGGELQVAVDNVMLPTALAPHMHPGQHVRIAVRDTGPGIAPEYLQRIFDPYFTTKSKGNGLGLTISYSIVKNHKGVLTVESQMGKGTCFFIYLPAVAAQETKTSGAPPMMQPGKGRILLMDDEVVILRTTRAVLEKLGYQVAISEHGAAAVEAFTAARAAQQPFDLVIVDMTVPGGMGGIETLRALQALDASVLCIATSGYFSDDQTTDLSQSGFKALLRKPYTIAQLQDTIRTVLRA
jgi:PAS domain S-box-containing protein